METALTNQTYIAETAIGLSYPTDSCPAVDPKAESPQKTCSIGDQPRYTVNATEVSDVVATVKYASQKNLRLVIRNTGHDILRRYTVFKSSEVLGDAYTFQIDRIWQPADMDPLSQDRSSISAYLQWYVQQYWLDGLCLFNWGRLHLERCLSSGRGQ